MFEKVGLTGRFCHVFIYIPMAFLAYTCYGFMTAQQVIGLVQLTTTNLNPCYGFMTADFTTPYPLNPRP
jgi:hypothetical protein